MWAILQHHGVPEPKDIYLKNREEGLHGSMLLKYDNEVDPPRAIAAPLDSNIIDCM